MPNKGRAVCLGLLFLITAANGFSQKGVGKAKTSVDPTVASIRVMKSRIVQIDYISDAPKNAIGVAGTGFFVSNTGYVLTAGHVINETSLSLKANGAKTVIFEVGVSLDASSTPGTHFIGSFIRISSTVVDVDQIHDVALLKVSRNPFTGEVQSGIAIDGKMVPLYASVATLKDELPPEGESVLVSGYPLSRTTLVTQRGMVASETYAEVQAPLPGYPGVTVPKTEESILLDAVVNPGNSGGPVYLPGSDWVIGICDAYQQSPLFTNKGAPVSTDQGLLMQNSGLAVVVPIKFGMALLQKNQVSLSGKP